MTRRPIRIVVTWFKDAFSGRIERDIEIDTTPDVEGRDANDVVRDACRAWEYDGYEYYRVIESPNIEYELVLHPLDRDSVAEEFLEDLVESLLVERA